MKGLKNFACILALLAASILAFSPDQSRAEGGIADSFRETLDGLFSDRFTPRSDADGAGDGQTLTDDADGRAVPQSQGEITLSFAPVVSKVSPSVVNVYTAKVVEVSRSPFAGDPFFERFFGRSNPFTTPRRRERMQNSLGSGVIVTSDGVILTNNHVIENADEVKVVLSDGNEYAARIILTDERSDLAVMKVDGVEDLQPIAIADSEEVLVGDLVLAVGNPFGVGQTVTMGIVSAVARSRVGINDFDFFIQTDAAINPGNSGGALVNTDGELIGINTAIYSRSGGSIGIGFAIPSNMARVALRSAIAGSDSVTRPWIGIDTQDVTAEIAESLGMRRPGGVLVASVFPGSPADSAGLQPGDVILGINEKLIANNDELGYRLDTIGIGNDADFVFVSDGERRLASIRLEPAPETVPRATTLMEPQTVLGGATVANISPAVAQEVGISARNRGVVIMEVERFSRAEANRVRKGDVVIAVNGVRIDDVRDLIAATANSDRRPSRVILERNGRRIGFDRDGRRYRQFRP